MNRTKTLLSIFAVAGVVLAIAWWQRPATSSTGTATSSRLYSISLPNKPRPNSFSETIAASGFVVVTDATFNSLLPPSQRNSEFESLPAFRRAEPLSSDTRLLGYRPGDTSAQLYVQTSGSQEHVQAFHRETEVLHEQLSK